MQKIDEDGQKYDLEDIASSIGVFKKKRWKESNQREALNEDVEILPLKSGDGENEILLNENDNEAHKYNRCSVGRRWIVEEIAFANRLIQDFRLGVLDIDDGTSLRQLLSRELKCKPMRISKKYSKDVAIGRQTFTKAIVSNLNFDLLQRKDKREKLKAQWINAMRKREKQRYTNCSVMCISEACRIQSLIRNTCLGPGGDSLEESCRVESFIQAIHHCFRGKKKYIFRWIETAETLLLQSSADVENLQDSIDAGAALVDEIKSSFFLS